MRYVPQKLSRKEGVHGPRSAPGNAVCIVRLKFEHYFGNVKRCVISPYYYFMN